MSLILEIPTEVENELREAARLTGREVEQFVLEAATEKADRLQGELTLAQAAVLLEVTPIHVQRLLESGRLPSFLARDVQALKRRYEAANRAMDEIVAMSEAAGLYEHGLMLLDKI